MTNILEAISFGATSTTDDVLSGVNLKGKRILSRVFQPESAWKRRAPWRHTALTL